MEKPCKATPETPKAAYEPPRMQIVALRAEERLLVCLKTTAPVPDCFGNTEFS